MLCIVGRTIYSQRHTAQGEGKTNLSEGFKVKRPPVETLSWLGEEGYNSCKDLSVYC